MRTQPTFVACGNSARVETVRETKPKITGIKLYWLTVGGPLMLASFLELMRTRLSIVARGKSS